MFLKIKNFFILLWKVIIIPPVHYCNCVCHSPASSRPYCEHCQPEWMQITKEEVEEARKFLKTIPKFHYDPNCRRFLKDKKKLDYALFIARENILEKYCK